MNCVQRFQSELTAKFTIEFFFSKTHSLLLAFKEHIDTSHNHRGFFFYSSYLLPWRGRSSDDDVDVCKGGIRFGDDIVTLVRVRLFLLVIFVSEVGQNLRIPTHRNNSDPR